MPNNANSKYDLRLYVCGNRESVQRSTAKLEAMLEDDDYALEVINILERPEQADRDKIIATPTLVRVKPPPVQKIVGDFCGEKALELILASRPYT